MRKITLKNLHLEQFKNHESLDIDFGVMNKIKGVNGCGKSSIGEGITWVLGGVDMMGSKLNPEPTDRAFDKVLGSVIMDVDGKEIKFGRELVKGKASYSINDIPKPATEFNGVVYSLTGTDSLDLFLSLFNPSYYPSCHWQDQRNMLFSFVSPPPQSEVLKKLPKLQADKLKESFKKNNIDELEAFHKKNKTNKEKEVIAAKSRVETLEGQMNGVEVGNLEELKPLLAEAQKAFEVSMQARVEYSNIKARRMVKEQALKSILSQIDELKLKNAKSKEQTSCLSCNQELSEETKKSVFENLNAEYKVLKKRHEELSAEIKGMVLPVITTEEEHAELLDNMSKLSEKTKVEVARLEALATIEEAKKKHVEVTASLTESIFLIDAIKAFKAEEAVQQAEKVKALFSGVQIVLEDHLGKPWFSIAMNGKNYVKLSLGEKARAGLELIAVLTQQSGILAPTFIDNAESITSLFVVEHQSIAAYAVPNTKLIVEVTK